MHRWEHPNPGGRAWRGAPPFFATSKPILPGLGWRLHGLRIFGGQLVALGPESGAPRQRGREANEITDLLFTPDTTHP